MATKTDDCKISVFLHVNYWEGAGKIDTLFKIADMNKYDGVELRWKYAFDDLNQEEYLSKVAVLKQQYSDMQISFGGMVDFMAEDRGQIKRDTEDYLKFLEWANRECGTMAMNFFTGTMVRPGADYYEFDRNGSAMSEPRHYEQSVKGLKIVGDKAGSLGMRLALETHNCYLHDLPGSCKKLMEMTNHEAVGINYDHGNIMINKNGCSIAEVFETIGDKIYYVHLKNLLMYKNDYFMTTRLEEGHIDNADILARLKNRGYNGVVTVEYACPGDGFIAARRDMEYIKILRDWLEV